MKPAGWRQGTLGELAAEALGTAIIILFGCGSVAMTVAALNQSDRGLSESVFVEWAFAI